MNSYEIKVAPAVREAVELQALTEQARSILSDLLAQSPDFVTAEWDEAIGEFGKPALTLRMTDFAGTSTGAFLPDEFQEPQQLRYHLWKVYDHLLANRIRVRLKRIAEMPTLVEVG
jgi:hypothetical protein